MKISPASLTRRQFLGNSAKAVSVAAATGFLASTRRLSAAPRRLAANEKLNLAFIGVAGRGGENLGEITSVEDVNIVALCDVDENRLNAAGTKFAAAKRYRDYRKLLEAEKSVDGVVISIPDHQHAPATVMALKLGRHVYCEKPLTSFCITSTARVGSFEHWLSEPGSGSVSAERCPPWRRRMAAIFRDATIPGRSQITCGNTGGSPVPVGDTPDGTAG